MKIIRRFWVLWAVFFAFHCGAQNIEVGTWRDHLPYHRGVSVASAGELVYCAAENSLFAYGKYDYSTTTISKVNGLSDIGFSKIAYHKGSKTLLIAYSNANIDLLSEGKIYNMSDIQRQNIPIKKVINNITFHGNDAWLSCGFGIVVLNMDKREFKATYLIADNGGYINVNDIKFYDDTVYAATDSGIYRASMNDYLPDYTHWHHWNDIPYATKKFNTLAFFNDVPFINYYVTDGTEDTLFYRENDVWKHYTKFGYERCYQLDCFGDKLVMTKMDNMLVLDKNMEVHRHIYDYTLGGVQDEDGLVSPAEAVIDDEGYLWVADKLKGLSFIFGQWAYKIIAPNGPSSINTFHIGSGGDQVWVATGAYSSTWSMTFRKDGLQWFDGFRWRTLNSATDGILDSIADPVCVIVNPSDHHEVFIGSWDKGLIHIKNGKVIAVYDETNSSLGVLENNALGIYRVAVGGVAYDESGYLWVTNGGVTKSLSVRKPNGSWRSFDISSSDMKMTDRVSGKVVIDRIGQKWVLLGRGYGIQVFNDNGTIDNPYDDQTANVNSYMGKGALPSTLVTDLAIDLEGRVWIGSDKGIAVIYTPENVFRGYSYDTQQIIVNQDGFDQILLENETVTAIAVDGGNRKWIGTEKSGVFLLSADGTLEIRRFHEGNSPLLSNGIRTISVNDYTGEVFFGTDKGIISYRSDATKGEEWHAEAKVFPNPVHPGYEGAIAITGLVSNADVKITNIAGEVVFSTRSQGGEAVWYGKDLSGRRVASGVYLVLSSNTMGEETAVAKILFIR